MDNSDSNLVPAANQEPLPINSAGITNAVRGGVNSVNRASGNAEASLLSRLHLAYQNLADPKQEISWHYLLRTGATASNNNDASTPQLNVTGDTYNERNMVFYPINRDYRARPHYNAALPSNLVIPQQPNVLAGEAMDSQARRVNRKRERKYRRRNYEDSSSDSSDEESDMTHFEKVMKTGDLLDRALNLLQKADLIEKDQEILQICDSVELKIKKTHERLDDMKED